MQVIVKARHMHLTRALKAHAEEKLGDSVMRVFDRPAAQLEVELSELRVKDGDNKECRVTVYMPKGRTITITEICDDMYKAIDLAHDRLLQQVKRERDRKSSGRKRRLEAMRERDRTAWRVLTAVPERWERELAEYERSTARL